MKTVLAISPHLDDAVFSAGATLARLADDGWRVIVATCFTASVENPSGFALACQLDKGLGPEIDYMALRRAEDRKACHVIGSEALHIPFAEAPHRGYGSPGALFCPVNADDRVANALGTALAQLIMTESPDLVLGPAAIGAHVDHVIVRRTIETVCPAAVLWADQPYAVRNGFDRGGFLPFACGDQATRKIEASQCYRSQLGFQFGDSVKELSALALNAEWFLRFCQFNANSAMVDALMLQSRYV